MIMFGDSLFKGIFRVEPRVLRSPTVLSRVTGPQRLFFATSRQFKLHESSIYRDVESTW